jgi:hypothetical protein
MFAIICLDTGKIVWSRQLARTDDVEQRAREFSKNNPGKTYIACYLYCKFITSVTEETPFK